MEQNGSAMEVYGWSTSMGCDDGCAGAVGDHNSVDGACVLLRILAWSGGGPGMMGGKGGGVRNGGKGDPNANGWVCNEGGVVTSVGVLPWYGAIVVSKTGWVMFEMSESLSLWMRKHSVAAGGARGVTVPERGDVGASEGSGLVSLRFSGGDSGWCMRTGDGVGDGEGGCRNRVGTWRGEARCRSGGRSALRGGAVRCLCETVLRGSVVELECGHTVSSKTRHRHLRATLMRLSQRR